MPSKLIKIQQMVFGCILLILGLNGFFKFLPIPEKAGFSKEFMDILYHTGYLMPTIACIQIGAGLSLLTRCWTNWGLLAMLPISFNIFCFHLLHDRSALVPAIMILGLNVFHLIIRTNASHKELQIRSII